jgi:4-hydroxy-4-methyl-2-oxoglutarate aldolase
MTADSEIDLQGLYSAVVCDVLDSLGRRSQSLPARVRPLTPCRQISGRAFTARARAVDRIPEEPYSLEIAAVEALKAGDVLVIDGGDDQTCGLWGELLTTACLAKEVCGVVMTACTRDLWKIRDLDFPVFGIGCHPGDSKGRIDILDIGRPIEIQGVAVRSGDYIVGDEDGVVVIPSELATQAIRMAREKVSGENVVRAELARGEPMGKVFKKYGIL